MSRNAKTLTSLIGGVASLAVISAYVPWHVTAATGVVQAVTAISVWLVRNAPLMQAAVNVVDTIGDSLDDKGVQ
ncbi:hypothetical protein ACIP5Y_21455 [Nocardia sp. NPDC088792]|uniref:hypothetical protein n=1 Tax=Nocardia sp. NPDC088792 TaxID=3364332 RepID=UPI0037FC09E0